MPPPPNHFIFATGCYDFDSFVYVLCYSFLVPHPPLLSDHKIINDIKHHAPTPTNSNRPLGFRSLIFNLGYVLYKVHFIGLACKFKAYHLMLVCSNFKNIFGTSYLHTSVTSAIERKPAKGQRSILFI